MNKRKSQGNKMKEFQEKIDHLLVQIIANYEEKLQGESPAACFYEDLIGMFEKATLKIAYEKFNGNQIKAAQYLGIHRNTFARKGHHFGIIQSHHTK